MLGISLYPADVETRRTIDAGGPAHADAVQRFGIEAEVGSLLKYGGKRFCLNSLAPKAPENICDWAKARKKTSPSLMRCTVPLPGEDCRLGRGRTSPNACRPTPSCGMPHANAHEQTHAGVAPTHPRTHTRGQSSAGHCKTAAACPGRTPF